jgi:hypothetical protein
MSDSEYFEHARREMFPKLKASALSMVLLGDPDPKLCLELGASILFNKPIIVLVPAGREVPLSLRTIANKIVEISTPPTEADGLAIKRAINEMVKAAAFRG